MSDQSEPWMRLLRELFGDDAEAALHQLESMGMTPDSLAQMGGVAASPAMMDHVLRQIRALVSQSGGEDVNWTLAHDVARGVAAQGGDPTVSAATASAYRTAVTTAELWLDAATDFNPATATPRVWSRAEWVEATLPTWRRLAGPVGSSVSQALTGVLHQGNPAWDADAPVEAGPTASLMGAVSPTVCGMHMGEAAGALAREAFGATDLGFLLLDEPCVVLVPRNVEDFAHGLDVPEEDVRAYVALREAAHVRLFGAAPWLAGQLTTLIARYAAGIRIDLDALDGAVRDAGMSDPQQLQQALASGIFTPTHSPEQQATVETIETWLALIEGWVDEVTTRAAAPHLTTLGPLREMMRRRRAAGGPAEDTFARLLGLELRPRRLRDASALWASLSLTWGQQRRDGLWATPEVLPSTADLAQWEAWRDRVVSGGEPDEMDLELQRLLDGEGE